MPENARSHGPPRRTARWPRRRRSSSRSPTCGWLGAVRAGRRRRRRLGGRPPRRGPRRRAECRGCPICRVRRALSDVSPEVYEHLADAVSVDRRRDPARWTASRRPRRRPMTLTIGVDVGGTKVAGGRGRRDGHDPRPAPGRHPGRGTPRPTTTRSPRSSRRCEPSTTSRRSGIGIAGFVDAARVEGLLRAQPARLARRAAARGGRAAGRSAGRRGERRERRGLGRGPLRRRPRGDGSSSA